MKVWVNGTFDILHIGHIKLLEHASTYGTVRVGLDSDDRVREKKGMDRPYNTLKDRMEFMRGIRFVDSVVSFDSDDSLIDRIKEYEPDIMVIGSDYIDKKIVGCEFVKEIIFFDRIVGKSTTKILNNDNNSNW